jgi:adenylate cyclase, class 2
MKEIETKIIDFDEKKLRANLKKAKAKYLGEIFFKRYVFILSFELYGGKSDEFVRIRTDGKTSTLTYKFRKGKGLANTEEIEVEVGDFENTYSIIAKIWKGRKPIYQENIVNKWIYKGVEIEIVKWPLIKPYIEIEAKSEKEIRTTIKELNISGTELGNTNLVEIFNLCGQHGKDLGDLKFKA